MEITNRKEVKRIRRSDCLEYEAFDRKYNVNTAHRKILALDGTGEYKPGGEYNNIQVYGSMGLQNTPLEILFILNDFMSRISNMGQYTFVDVGSGKGRVNLYNILSNAPYKQYLGIEVDPVWSRIALENTLTTNIDINKPIKLLNENILSYDLLDEPSVYYFYYPVTPSVFHQFISKNLEKIIKTKSYVVFFIEEDYNFEMYSKTPPIYNDFGITIYQMFD
jgi:hypothetical protein